MSAVPGARGARCRGGQVPRGPGADGAGCHGVGCHGAGCYGAGVAPPLPIRRGMVARRYQDLVVWQLADELKQKVYELIETSLAKSDFQFRDQLRASAASAPTNLAEGFAYYRHGEFARHVRIARSEIVETHNHLGDGVQRGYWSLQRAMPLRHLANRARGAATGLLEHLLTTEAPSDWPGERKRR